MDCPECVEGVYVCPLHNPVKAYKPKPVKQIDPEPEKTKEEKIQERLGNVLEFSKQKSIDRRIHLKNCRTCIDGVFYCDNYNKMMGIKTRPAGNRKDAVKKLKSEVKFKSKVEELKSWVYEYYSGLTAEEVLATLRKKRHNNPKRLDCVASAYLYRHYKIKKSEITKDLMRVTIMLMRSRQIIRNLTREVKKWE